MASPLSTGGSSSFELDLDKAAKLIRRSGAKLVGLQVPEGLKRAAPGIARQIEGQAGAKVIISGDPCFGACDIDMALCREVDLMLHLGHSEIEDAPDKVVFLEARIPSELRGAAEKAAPLLRSEKVGVAATVQHIHKLDQAIEGLKQHGIRGLVGSARGRARYPGQVLGCCYNTAKMPEVDEILFIGTGQFHPMGIALATGKRVIAADPVTGEVSEIISDALLRRRFGTISRAKEAEKFAVLVSKKPGQRRMELARRIKDLGEEKGREMILVFMDNIEPDRLTNLGLDAAVSTACPRIALDDAAKFGIPILTPPEFEIMLGERQWGDYIFDEME